jgi:hypothetical protein
MRSAFLVYTPTCRLTAVRLWDELRWHGLDVGIDLQDVPVHFDRMAVLEDMVSACSVLLLLMDATGNNDESLRRLHLLAIEQDCQVVALLMPGGELPSVLRTSHMIYMGNYDRAFKHILRVIPKSHLHQATDPEELAANLRHTSADVRRLTVHQLVETHHRTKLAPLIPRLVTLVLSDEDSHVRAVAATLLGQTGNTDMAATLLLALWDENPIVRNNAVWGLVTLGRRRDAPASRAITPAAIAILRDTTAPQPIRHSAYELLLRLGGNEAYDAIDRYWDDSE